MDRLSTVIANMNARWLEKNGSERLGQAYFNELVQIAPEFAEKIRGTNADPFYLESPTDPRWNAFYVALENEFSDE